MAQRASKPPNRQRADLPQELQRELDVPWRNVGSDCAKSGAGLDVGVRHTPVHIVQRVEPLGAKLHGILFVVTETEVLEKR